MQMTRRLLFPLLLIPLALLLSAAQTEPPTPTPDAPTPEVSLIPLREFVAVAAGVDHTCALDEQGGVWCWGSNWAGQLGDGTTDRRETAVEVAGLSSGVKALAAGANFTCALTAGGGVKCWGRNAEGQLGNGLTDDVSIPVDVLGLESGASALAAGQWHACAVTDGGRVLCWGDNNWGKAGGNRDESDQDLVVPQPVQGLAGTYVDVAAGFRHTCAVSVEGAVECWGAIAIPGVSGFMRGPTAVPDLESGVAQIAAGPAHTCAALSDGGLRCWGDNDHGQLGAGTFGDEQRMMSVSGLPGPVQAVTLGADHTCATVDGKALCWGNNAFGQLGDGRTDDRALPAEVQELGGAVISLSAGYNHSCAVAGGEVRCWGYHLAGQLGEGARPYQSSPVAVIGLDASVRDIAAGDTHTCALTVDGGLTCWGDDRNGELGDGRNGMRGIPAAVIGLEPALAVTAGNEFTCALTEAGEVWCWGRNTYGELGSGEDDDSSAPLRVVGLPASATAVAAGSWHACALTDAGGVLCWGHNNHGQLGQGGALEESNTPVEVVGLNSGVRAITAGFDHSCALLESGEVHCWGEVLGAQDDLLTETPARMEGLPADVETIFEADFDTCAVTAQGGLYCLQGGEQGFEPVEVPFRPVGGGGGLGFRCVLDERGGVWCEGQDDLGQLGDGTTASRSEFAQVVGLTSGVARIAAGQSHACAVLDSGRVMCWGDNNFGQLGDGTVPRSLPVAANRAGVAASQAFRLPSTFVPELTTYIPTPLDVSTDPAVVGTNLALAALAMLPFAVAAELLTRTLSERRLSIPGRSIPTARLAGIGRWMGDSLRRLIRHDRLREISRFALILLFYGLTFSLLDRSWKPFTLGGLVLLGYMTVAYGVVGLADDIAQWRAARNRRIPARLKLRPASVLLAIASTATTRLLQLVPGLMFGTPEALELDEAGLDESIRKRLTRVSALTLVGVALGLWIPSALTRYLQERGSAGAISTALGGLEAFLVLTFAVALENLFVKLLGLPGTMGEGLRRHSRWLWLGALVVSGFAFYHTLLNPRGELATALAEGNVRLFLGAVAVFVLLSFSVWIYFRWRERAPAAQRTPPGLRLPTLKLPARFSRRPKPPRAGGRRLAVLPPSGARPMDDAPALPGTPPVVVAAGLPGTPPVVEAAGPPGTPPVVKAAGPPGTPAIVEARASATGLAADSPMLEGPTPASAVQVSGPETATKKCPMCAETIMLEARICRYCRTGFEITVQGYCARDHTIVELDARDRCCRCGGEAIDRQVRSVWLGEGSGSPVSPIGRTPPVSGTTATAPTIPGAAIPAPHRTVAAPAAPMPEPVRPAESRPAEAKPRRRRGAASRIALPAAGITIVAIGAAVLVRSANLRQSAGAPVGTPGAALPALGEATGVSRLVATPRPTRSVAPTRTSTSIPTSTPLPAWVDEFAGPILSAIADREPHFDGFNPVDWGPPWLDFQEGRVRVEQGDKLQDVFLRGRGLYDFVQVLDVAFDQPDVGVSLHWYGSGGDLYLSVIPRAPSGWDWALQVPAEGRSATAASGNAPEVHGLSASITFIRHGSDVAAFLNDVPLVYLRDPELASTFYGYLSVPEKSGDRPTGVVWLNSIRMWDLRLIPDLRP